MESNLRSATCQWTFKNSHLWGSCSHLWNGVRNNFPGFLPMTEVLGSNDSNVWNYFNVFKLYAEINRII
jgi:hypothetical protein